MGSRRLTIVACSVALLAGLLSGVASAETVVRTPSEATYEVSLTSGATGRSWRGTERVTFTNTGANTLRRVWVRVWANGVEGCGDRAVTVRPLSGGTLGRWRHACTAVPVHLASPVSAGGQGSFHLRITIQVPARNDRFGSYRGMTFLGGALPILAVHDDEGWHLDPYVDLGESFYSLVGDYDVEFDVPAGLRTPSTGRVTAQVAQGDRVIRSIVADDVREFSWAAGDFRSLASDEAGPRVRVWYLPGVTERTTARRVLSRSVESLATFSDAFDAYSAPEIDVVVTAFTTFGGMEYPEVVFTNPNRITVAHEIAHQWWYAAVGNDQFAEPWLDESLATWSAYLPFSPWDECKSYRWASPTSRLSNDMAYWRDHPREYGDVYLGGACMMGRLADQLGLNTVVRMLRRYAARNWLGVARTEDFHAIVEATAARRLPGFDADAFWSEWRLS